MTGHTVVSGRPVGGLLVVAFLVVMPALYGAAYLLGAGWLGTAPHDLFWAVAALVAVAAMLMRGQVEQSGALAALGVLLLLFLSSVLFRVGVSGGTWQSSSLAAIELKPAFYLAVACSLLGAGAPTAEQLRGGLRLFAAIYLAWAFLAPVEGVGGRPVLLAEANYDGLIVLLGLSFELARKNSSRRAVLLFLVATLATQSRTGSAVALALLMLKAFRDRRVVPIVLASAFAAVFVVLAASRIQVASLESIDRVVMWLGFASSMADQSIGEIVAGNSLGAPIGEGGYGLGWYIARQTTPLGGWGLHPLNLHSFHARFVASHGLLLFVALGVSLWFAARKNPARPYLLALALLQGVSMSLFYTSVCAVPTLLALSARAGNGAES